MTTPDQHDNHVETLLAAERPHASEQQLARVKALARARARAPRYFPRQKGVLMKPRLAITFMLTLGLLMSGSGATLAVISDGDSAAISQYPDSAPGGVLGGSGGAGGGGGGGVLGDSGEAGGGVLGDSQEQPGGVLGDQAEGAAPAAGVEGDRDAGEAGDVAGATAQGGRQVGAGGGGELPFTGLASIPLMVGGILMLVLGLALRRTARRPADA